MSIKFDYETSFGTIHVEYAHLPTYDDIKPVLLVLTHNKQRYLYTLNLRARDSEIDTKTDVVNVLRLLARIVETYGKQILKYAVWYLKEHAYKSDKDSHIHRETCRLILETNFLGASGMNWKVVEIENEN